MNISLKNKVPQVFLLIFLAFIWGSSFLLMKKGLVAYSASEMAALRIVIAGIALLPFAVKNLKLIFSSHGKWLLIAALSGNGIPAFLFAKAQTVISSSLSGMLNSLTPLFTLVIAVFFFRVAIGSVKILGVLIGLAGTLALVYTSGTGAEESNYWYSGLVLCATLCYGISVNVLKEKLAELKAEVITALAFFIIAPPCLIYLLVATPVLDIMPTEEGLTSLIYIGILSVFGTALAVVLFNKLIKHTSSVFASSVTYLIPIVALFWGFMDGELITWAQLGLFTAILCGVSLVMKSDNKN
ncbi:MAG: DMT family transporter [Flavobacteriales bacterium]|nr:DMT family transporter [Flavobacteriales bacterium]